MSSNLAFDFITDSFFIILFFTPILSNNCEKILFKVLQINLVSNGSSIDTFLL